MRVRFRVAATILVLASSVLSGLALTTGDAAAAKRRADLRVTGVANPPAEVEQGARFRVRARVANKGTRKTGRRTVVRILLSRDRRLGRTDRVLRNVRIKKLARGASTRVSVRVKVRTAIPAGRYRVLVCADATGRVRESREGNNCRASKRRVRVTSAEPTPEPPTVTFPKPSDPIDVSATMHPGHAVTRSVTGHFDQTITATGPDGTTFALTIPKGALLSSVDITMTPVAAIEGFPLTDLVGAVEIQPHGLRLLRPATLVITPPSGTPVADLQGFLFAQDGLDFHRYPVQSGAGITLHLSHFSTPGVGTGTPAQLDRVDLHPPSDMEAQFEGAAAEAMQEGGSVQDVVDSYVDQVVEPQLEQAQTNDVLAQDAISDALSLIRMAELMGVEIDGQALWDKIMEVLRNALEKSVDRCVDEHALSEILRLVSMARTWQLLGFEVDGDNILARMEKCARFDVEFTSTVTHTDQWPLEGHEWGKDFSAVWSVRTTVPVAIDFRNGLLLGESTLEYTRFEYKDVRTHRGGDACPTWTRTTSADGTSPGKSGARLELDLNQYAPPRAGVPGVVPRQRVEVSTTSYTYPPVAGVDAFERYHSEGGCTDPNPTDQNLMRWAAEANFVHQRAGRTTGVAPLVVDFAAIDQSGATIFEKSWSDRWDSTCSGECDNHRTAQVHVAVVHTPVR